MITLPYGQFGEIISGSGLAALGLMWLATQFMFPLPNVKPYGLSLWRRHD